MILADADQSLTCSIEGRVSVEPIAGWRDRRRRARPSVCCDLDAIDSLIGEVREIHRTIREHEGSPAVLLHAGADVETRWRHLAAAAVGPHAHEHVASAVLWPSLQPVHIVAIDGDAAHPKALRGDRFGRDWGRPRSEGFSTPALYISRRRSWIGEVWGGGNVAALLDPATHGCRRHGGSIAYVVAPAPATLRADALSEVTSTR